MERIVDVLRGPEVAGSSGTLLFALNELGASLPPSLLVHLVEHGSFEGRAEALIAMEEGRITLGSEVETGEAGASWRGSRTAKAIPTAPERPGRRSNISTPP